MEMYTCFHIHNMNINNVIINWENILVNPFCEGIGLLPGGRDPYFPVMRRGAEKPLIFRDPAGSAGGSLETELQNFSLRLQKNG